MALSASLDIPLDVMLQSSLLGCHRARRSILGPLSPSFDPHSWLSEVLTTSLSEEDHHQVSGKLHISLTKVYDGGNLLVNQFSTLEELKRVSVCVLADSVLSLIS